MMIISGRSTTAIQQRPIALPPAQQSVNLFQSGIGGVAIASVII